MRKYGPNGLPSNLKNSGIWRTAAGKRWKLADFMNATADEVRNAQKPSDLSFPISRTLDLIHKVREHQYEWLERTLKLNPEERGRWPHL